MKINTLEKGEQVKKYHVALLLNSGTSENPSWVQIEKSTDNTITMNAETEDRDFIVDVNPTTVLTKYKPSLSEPITLYKGNPDYEYFWKKFYKMDVGNSAVTEILVVFMNETGEKNTDAYEAWKCECACVCDNLNPVDSTLTFTINFNGTVSIGYVTVGSEDGIPTFSETEPEASSASSDSTSSDTSSSDSTSSDSTSSDSGTE